MLKIYRTSDPDIHSFEADEPVVRFGPEHAWLTKAVAVPRFGDGPVLRGPVEDGHITDAHSGDSIMIWKGGDEDGIAYHETCYELVGSPAKDRDAITGVGLFPWAIVDAYDGQLFEHHEFRAHGFGWVTEDSPRARAHREALAARAKVRPAPVATYTTVRELVASNRGWSGLTMRDDAHEPVHIIHYRDNLHPGLDTDRYPFLVWAMKDTDAKLPAGEEMQALIAYETALVEAAERDDAAIVLMTTIGLNQTQYLIQARDEEATKSVLAALPSPAKTTPIHFDNERDPGWKNFFEKMDPRGRR